jgi:hypothetical protein
MANPSTVRTVSAAHGSATALDTEFHRGLGLYDSTMVVVGSMIGSGIFIVSADMSRKIGSPGWLLGAWVLTGLLTVVGALSYGELAAMMPRAGGQYVYLREAFSPLWGFLYGWTLFLVIQTGTIAAVGVGFARYFGALVPWIRDDNYLVPPIHLSSGYALSLSTTQIVGILMIAFLTWTNTRGLQYGKIIQNVFTTAKTGALLGLIVVGVLIGRQTAAPPASDAQVQALRQDLRETRQLVTLALLTQSSASERLTGVALVGQMESPGPAVRTALLDRLMHDANVNVRLAAVDALQRFRDEEMVRRGAVDALARQTSPLVQIALIDFVISFKGPNSIETLRRLSSNPMLDEAVRRRAAWAIQQVG